MSFSAVVVAAGAGLRAGPGEPKVWRSLAGRPIVRWSVEGLLAAGAREVIVVVARDRLGALDEALDGLPNWRAVTGGRTRANYALELETLISAKDYAATGGFPEVAAEQIECISIMEECRTPRSVAEIVSALRVPLGVARVLISDAADAGLVTVHKTITGNDGAEAHLVLMERVLSGLRRL